MALILTRDQVRRVDQIAIEQYGIAGVVLMENAGRNAAAVIDTSYGPSGEALVVCGTGNNGGDGYVIARHLHNAGWSVRVVTTGDESRMTPDALTNYRIVRAMGLDLAIVSDQQTLQGLLAGVRADDVIIDALLGTGFRGDVREPTVELIAGLNGGAKRAIVAVDVPSGLDCDTGMPSNATIRADLTVTFVASKIGFAVADAKPYIGSVEVVDIGAPRGLIEDVLSEDA
jgi:NAD(P)H-hydrate epimerase